MGPIRLQSFLLAPGQQNGAFAAFEPVRGHRYCQALMKARHGESVLLEPAGLSCPAAAAAFGFRPLPPQLANGKGLVGFGIVADEAVGKRMFAGMPRLADGQYREHRAVSPASCTASSRHCGCRRLRRRF